MAVLRIPVAALHRLAGESAQLTEHTLRGEYGRWTLRVKWYEVTHAVTTSQIQSASTSQSSYRRLRRGQADGHYRPLAGLQRRPLRRWLSRLSSHTGF